MSQYDDTIKQLHQQLQEKQKEYKEVNEIFQKQSDSYGKNELSNKLKEIFTDINNIRTTLNTYIALKADEEREPEPEPEPLPDDYYDKLYSNMSVEDWFGTFFEEGN